MATGFLADRVRETTTTTGTGTITLAGASTGYQAFSSAFANGDRVTYVIYDGTSWEIGLGTYTSSTIVRDQITASSNSGNAVSWAAGSKDVWCDASAFYLRLAMAGYQFSYSIFGGV
jgi:hypothetical protein